MYRLAVLFTVIAVSVNVRAMPTLLSGNCDQLRDKDKYDCELAFESELVQAHSKFFERKDGTLTLKTLLNSQSQSFIDKPAKSWSEHGGYHRVIAFYPDLRISHIRVIGYEYYSSFVFRHLYGTKADAMWKVKISPDSKLLVGFSAELETNWRANGIAIYSIEDMILKPLVSYHPTGFGIKDVKFISSSEIELTTVCYSRNWKERGRYDEGKAYLNFTDSVWQISQISCGE